MSNREFEEKQEGFLNTKLAKVLGISMDDLSKTNYEIDTNESNEGLVYNLLINFGESSPKEILRKIKGLDENNTVWLNPNALD